LLCIICIRRRGVPDVEEPIAAPNAAIVESAAGASKIARRSVGLGLRKNRIPANRILGAGGHKKVLAFCAIINKFFATGPGAHPRPAIRYIILDSLSNRHFYFYLNKTATATRSRFGGHFSKVVCPDFIGKSVTFRHCHIISTYIYLLMRS